MKKIILIISLVFVSFAANADELIENVSTKISEYAAGLIPGEGHTEVSIDLRKNHSPDFSILGVREILPIEDGKIFTQFSLFNTERDTGDGGDERYIGNLGFGARKLAADNTIMFGINNFWDYEVDTEHMRTSIGAEVRSAVIDLHINRYLGTGDEYNEENVLDGWDFGVASQIPYLHWAKAFVTGYQWEGILRDDVNGTKYGSEMALSPNFNLELAYDDKDAGTTDEWYSKLQFVHPGNAGPTALTDGISDTPWKENRDMSGELLSKVKRSNKIMIEFKGSATISRTD